MSERELSRRSFTRIGAAVLALPALGAVRGPERPAFPGAQRPTRHRPAEQQEQQEQQEQPARAGSPDPAGRRQEPRAPQQADTQALAGDLERSDRRTPHGPLHRPSGHRHLTWQRHGGRPTGATGPQGPHPHLS
ncbi:hypothetical protein GCM10018785_02070 [Streptomyces longispororuber]|uniref:Uncharacterized protein n=1 Tax=Streptomyces longispororuber TaxID=68230 RepID=A0A918Z3F7_9ACTN|nr:hypothetical protein GCM10018785_02070 [Streptomyces longispororuber]